MGSYIGMEMTVIVALHHHDLGWQTLSARWGSMWLLCITTTWVGGLSLFDGVQYDLYHDLGWHTLSAWWEPM